MRGIYDDHGVRFAHPTSWELDEAADDARTTLTVQSPTDPAFVIVTVDDDRPEPSALAEEALSAMREEYPTLEVRPFVGMLAGVGAEGYDLEFFSLDAITECAIRAFRLAERSALVFAQWSSVESGDDEEDPEEVIRALMASIEAGTGDRE